jgi:hypothetical protein
VWCVQGQGHRGFQLRKDQEPRSTHGRAVVMCVCVCVCVCMCVFVCASLCVCVCVCVCV